VWDINTGSCIKTLNGHEHNVSCVEFLPQGDKLVSSSRDKSIKIWDMSSGYCIKTLHGHENWVKRVTPNHDGTLLASCSTDNV
jgi:platelet-activating factor acetylhydrolase IB subunit alpha